MRKVLYFLPSDLIGGAETQTRLLIKNLPRDKYDPIVATAPVHNSGASFIAELKKLCKVVFIDEPNDLLHTIRKENPDVIQHFHNMTVGPVLKYMNYRGKSIEVVHGRFHFPSDVTKTPKEFTNHIVAVSKDAAEFFLKKHPKWKDNLTIIPNGVDTDELSKIAVKSASSNKLPVKIGHVGRLCEGDKRITKIIDICRATLPKECYELHLFGTGADEVAIKDYAASAVKMGHKIVFHGHKEDVTGIYRLIDVFVSRSEAEGFGLSIAEAAAAGLPIVMWDCGGVSNYFKNKEVCLVNSDIEFANCLTNLIYSPQARHELGRRAQETAVAELSAIKMTRDYVSLYDKLLGSNGDPIGVFLGSKDNGVITISNPNFVGVTNAMQKLAGKEFHIPVPPIQNSQEADTVAKKLFWAKPKVLIVGGDSNYSNMIEMFRKMSPSTKIVLQWHGTTAFNSFAQNDALILSHYIKMLEDGTIDRVGFVSKHAADLYKSVSDGCVYLPNRVSKRLEVKPKTVDKDYLNVGVFGTSYPWKNQIGAALIAGLYGTKDGRPVMVHTNKFGDFSDSQLEDLVKSHRIYLNIHKNIPPDEFPSLLSAMDFNMMLSFTESFGQVAVESFRCGVPCIVSSAVQAFESSSSEICVKNPDSTEEVWAAMEKCEDKKFRKYIVEWANRVLNSVSDNNDRVIADVIGGLVRE